MISIQRNSNARVIFWVHRKAIRFFFAILPISTFFPIAPSFAASPIAQVGSSSDGGQAWISLANGAQIIAAPGKDLLELRGDANKCLYTGTAVEVYLTCLHNAGDTIKRPNGEIWKGASPTDFVSPPNVPAGSQRNSSASASTPTNRQIPSDAPVQKNSKTTNCTTTKGYGGDYMNCDDGTQATTTHGFGGDYTTADDGTKSTTVHGIGGAYTSGGGRHCTTIQGMAGDYTNCDDGTKCTTTHGYGGDYTTCSKN